LGADGDGFVLPNINTPASKQSPFKGFLDVSLVTQKLKKAMQNENSVEFPTDRSNRKQGITDNLELIQPKYTRFKSTDKQV
jgi:hypothetical protein